MTNFNKTPKILVVGDLIIDHYLWGVCERISPEAPVQIVKINKESTILGGAGNVINNLVSLGSIVDVISVIGTGETSEELKILLENINVDTKYLINQNDRITSKKSRIIASQQQVVRYDLENTDDINKQSQKIILDKFRDIVKNYDLVLFSDYGKGVLTASLTKKLISIAKKNNKKVLVDPKGLDFSKYTGAYLLTPNKKEAGEATHSIINDEKSLRNVIESLKIKYKLSISLITLSDQGVAVFDKKFRIHPTNAREVFDVTGAGDTILASLGFALACDKNIDEAVKFSNLAAGVVVGKIGAACTNQDEIVEYESNLNKPYNDNNVKTFSEISKIVKELKNKNKKIIFTNGCFDILHFGHIKYLEESKSFGDILIVGLNSDDSVKKLKGNNRPINNEDDRSYILSSLDVVDFVVIFNEDTPLKLIKHIQPDVLVKGGDYANKKVVGQDFVKEFKLVKFIEGKSTTNTINRISN
jgi:D-beta-D-heptose 7-phosphate kinase / D-beta-D-heptose 1-phosphate adenosyltransferase